MQSQKQKQKRKAEKRYLRSEIYPNDDQFSTRYKARKSLIRDRVLRREARQQKGKEQRKAAKREQRSNKNEKYT